MVFLYVDQLLLAPYWSPKRCVFFVFAQLQEKFRLDMDDEACIHFFQDLINESVSALFPQMVETIHRWAQYWR